MADVSRVRWGAIGRLALSLSATAAAPGEPPPRAAWMLGALRPNGALAGGSRGRDACLSPMEPISAKKSPADALETIRGLG